VYDEAELFGHKKRADDHNVEYTPNPWQAINHSVVGTMGEECSKKHG